MAVIEMLEETIRLMQPGYDDPLTWLALADAFEEAGMEADASETRRLAALVVTL